MATAAVIRPGETDFDTQSRIQGSLDLPLNEAGSRQVQEIIEQLGNTPLEVIYTSATEPARSTAKQIADHFGLPLRTLDDLENLDHGLWQGMLVKDIRRKHPRVFKQWRESPEAVCPPKGETCPEAHARVQRALRKPLRKQKPFAVVAPEPLATLVASVLRGEAPRLPGPICGCRGDLRIEVISQFDPKQAGAGRSPGDDRIPVDAAEH